MAVLPVVDKGWVVWCPPKGGCSKVHHTKEEALREAKRLAEKENGYVFHVLEIIGAFAVPKAEAAWLEAVPPFTQPNAPYTVSF